MSGKRVAGVVACVAVGFLGLVDSRARRRGAAPRRARGDHRRRARSPGRGGEQRGEPSPLRAARGVGGYGTQRSASGVTCSSCVAARAPCSARKSTAAASSRGSAAAACTGPVSAIGWMPASMISSATWMPCSRSSSAAACVIALHAERARGPEAAPGGGAARRAAGRLDHRRGRALLEQERAGRGEEREGGAGRGGGPGVERLGRRACDRPAAERAAAIAAVGCRGVEDEIDRAVRPPLPARAPRARSPGRSRRRARRARPRR